VLGSPRNSPSSLPLPGRNPAEAAAAFLEPLQSALGCVLHGKLVPSAGGRTQPGVQHAWTLNQGAGGRLSSGHVLKAAMRYEIIEDADKGPWRVTTHGYMYGVEDGHGLELLAVHWHPATAGRHKQPHLHFPDRVVSPEGGFLAREPVTTGRMTFEDVIRFCVRNLQAEPLRDDWEDRLLLAETPHRLYRSWHQTPAERDQPID
jgi:hypothetical protein